MEITQNERLKILEMKDAIRSLCEELLDLYYQSENDVFDLSRKYIAEKKMLHVLSLLYAISSYTKPDRDLEPLRSMVLKVINSTRDNWQLHRLFIPTFCVSVNSIVYSYQKRGFFSELKQLNISPNIGLNV